MKNFLNNRKRVYLLLSILLIAVFAQALVIGKLYSEKSNRPYEVNIVKINTKKDSVDYLKMRNNLGLVDASIRQIHNFLISKNVPDEGIASLAQDSLSSTVYIAKQSNRYSQYLVDLEKKLQEVPLGMPSDGYISSNFGNRKNPIPFKPKNILNVPKEYPKPQEKSSKVVEEKDSLGNIVKRTVVIEPLNTQKPSNLSTNKEAAGVPAEEDQIQFHKGLDIAVAYGSDVRCAATGTVIWAGPKGGYGNCVIVSHANGLATLYGHLSQILVQVNDNVKVGQVIAKSGNSGRSTGPHLHYEVHKNGSPVNPKLFMNL